MFLLLAWLLIIFSEGVDFFPVDFFGEVVLEVVDFFRGEGCADSAEGASENFHFFFVGVSAFFAGHVSIGCENL